MMKTGRPIGLRTRASKTLWVCIDFPLALRLLKPDDERLGHLMHNLRDETRGLWSPYGMRSLSKRQTFRERRKLAWQNMDKYQFFDFESII